MKALANVIVWFWLRWLEFKIWRQHVHLAWQEYRKLRLTYQRDMLLRQIESAKARAALAR